MFHEQEGSDPSCSYIIRQQMILMVLIMSGSQHIASARSLVCCLD